MSSSSSSHIQRMNKGNQLRSQLQNTDDIAEKIKIHQAAVKMIEERENDEDFNREFNQHRGIQAIPLLSTNSRGPTLSSFDPSAEEEGTTSASNENLFRPHRRTRGHSISSESSSSVANVRHGSMLKAPSTPNLPDILHERLTPDAEKRVFNYNYRGAIPTHRHCQRSLFGKHVEVTPEPKVPKRRSQSQNNRIPLRRSSHERVKNVSAPKYNHRPGMRLHEGACNAARQVHDSRYVRSESAEHKHSGRVTKKKSLENVSRTYAKERLDAWRPMDRSKSSNFVKPSDSSTPEGHAQDSAASSIFSGLDHQQSFKSPLKRGEVFMPTDYSTPKKQTPKDFRDFVVPSFSSELNKQQMRTPVKREEITSPEFFQTPSAFLDDEFSDHDSFESAKEFQTPQKAAASNLRRTQQIAKEDFEDETEAELAKIDAILAAVTPSRTRERQKLVSRPINLMPATDYRCLKETTVEKNIEEVQAAIASSKLKENVQPTSFNKSQDFKGKEAVDAFDVLESNSSPQNQTLIRDSPVNQDNDFDLTTPLVPIKAAATYHNAHSDFTTPKASTMTATRTTANSDLHLTPNTRFKTSLKRDKLIQNFKESLKLNMKAKKKFCKSEKEYYQQIGESKKAARMSEEIEKLSPVFDTAMEYVRKSTENYTEESVRAVLNRMKELQADARNYIDEMKERKKRRRRNSLSFGPLGVIDANSFEQKHLEALSRRHENAIRISEAVKKVNMERTIVEMQERKAVKGLVRLSLEKNAVLGLSETSSSSTVTESTLTRRSVTLTTTKIPKLIHSGSTQRKMGKVIVRNPSFIEENVEVEEIASKKSATSSSTGNIISSERHIKVTETKLTRKLSFTDNLMHVPPASGLSTATGSIVPRLDLSVLEETSSKNAKPDVPQEIIHYDEQKEEDLQIADNQNLNSKPAEAQKDEDNSGGRTSRDISSISEFEPVPHELQRSSNDDKKTENDASSIHDIEESIHDDSTLTPHPSPHVDPKPIEHLHTPSEESIFSALPSSRTHHDDENDLQSLPDPLSSAESEKNEEKKEEEVAVVESHEEIVQNADSDPERVPLSGTTAGTFNASPISSSKLLGDSPIPSPPFIEPSQSYVDKKKESLTSTTAENAIAEEEKEVTEASEVETVHSSKSPSISTESSNVVIPSSLEVSDAIKPPVAITVELDDKSMTTSVSTETSATTSVGSTAVESSTTSVGSSSSSGDKTPSAKSSDDSIPEELPSTAKSNSSTSDFSSFAQSQPNDGSRQVGNTPAYSSHDDVSENSFQSSFNQAKHSSSRRKSWDMVETGIIGKQSPSYLKGDTIDADIAAIFGNEPPKFECAPPALGPYAAVSPRSPRSERNRHSFSRSPLLPKPASSYKGEAAPNYFESLLDDVSLSKISAPIFDISGGSDRDSLSFKDGKNIFEWSPGLSKEEPTRIENAENEVPEVAPVSETTSISTVIDEPILEKSVKEVSEEIKRICTEIWPQLQSDKEDFKISSYSNFDAASSYHDAFRRLLVDVVVSEVKNLQQKYQHISFEKFLKQITEVVLTKLSIERKNDLLDGRHVWVRKNNNFVKIVDSRQEALDYKSDFVSEYKRVLVSKAVAYEEIINYSKNSSHQMTNFAYEECVKFMEKHEPEKLEALLSQYSS